MNDSSNRDVEIFTEVLRLDRVERAAYLECVCGGELRQRVEALLEANECVGDFLEDSPQTFSATARAKVFAGEKPGDRIGRYKLLEEIGEGGCGVVFVAQQEEPVRRLVALKIIKPGMDTKSVIARFEAERQALALMDHPNIAKVFDAGATDSGRPYFVMELIKGIKITEYCDRHSLTTKDRLILFAQVCGAVQHAHQKGIIHRDIKPSNILVTTSEQGASLPVVIDFGIAKATTNQQLTDKTFFTSFEMLIGTPAYMSPEQAALSSGVDVDTRTDIYSLGVLLYELLTGSTPFDAAALLKVGLDEVRRVIREQEPARPSTRLSTMTAGNLTIEAQHRQTTAPTLIRAIRGDLDWIAMKAMEKDRTRRYPTAHGLALDVQRYLASETVSACPPSALYKFQKLVRRNKLLFAAIGIIAALLVTGVIVLSSTVKREREALVREHEARMQAVKDKVKAEQVMKFVQQLADNNEDIISTLSHLADTLEADGKITESKKMRNRVLALDRKPGPGDTLLSPDELGTLLAIRASAEARRGQWEEAAADAAHSLDYQPTASFRYTMVAALYLKTHNRSAYEQLCKKLFLQFRDTRDIFFADQVAKACLFLPASEVDLNAVNHLADVAVTLGIKDEGAMPFFGTCKALAEYRLGHFASAVEWAQKTLLSARKDAHPHAYGVLALADWKLGKKEDARAMLAAGENVAPRMMPQRVAEDPGTGWLVWLFARIQLDEAEALINSTSQASSQELAAADALKSSHATER